MANYTQHYGLHQWEPGDSFLRTDFNGDFAKLDAALAQKADAARLEEKCAVTVGTYAGDGSEKREIALGFRPKVLLLRRADADHPLLLTDGGGQYVCQNRVMLALTDRGFQVDRGTYKSGAHTMECTPYTNRESDMYHYMVLR